MSDANAYVIEIGEETAGIVAAEKRGFRFYSSDNAYAPLEGALFNTPRAAEFAARALRKRSRGASPRARKPAGGDASVWAGQ